MIKKLSITFGSKTKAQEIIFLLHGLKEVVRQGYYEHELPQVEKFCRDNNLFLVKSRFKVLLAEENYSNKGLRIPEDDKRDGMFFIYISKDEKKSLLAAYHELMQNDKDLGLILGYPECCVEFFCNNFNEKNTDLQLTPTNMWTNLTKREKDAVLISHFPCSSACQKSITMGMRNLELLAKIDEERAEELAGQLGGGGSNA